jgi:hypothetical protein
MVKNKNTEPDGMAKAQIVRQFVWGVVLVGIGQPL